MMTVFMRVPSRVCARVILWYDYSFATLSFSIVLWYCGIDTDDDDTRIVVIFYDNVVSLSNLFDILLSRAMCIALRC